MFIVRNVRESDLEELHELSQLITLINLPNDKQKLKSKIHASVKTFRSPSTKLEDNFYIFVLVNSETKKIVGASMIHGKHGTSEEPHFFLRVGREHKFSTSLNTGFIHGTLKFGLETDGHTEIGGLILSPKYRGHPDKLGKILSFARFHYIGQHPQEFTHFIHSELLPPFDKNGNSPLWEAIGRPFLNMDYHDADKLSRENKEFITSLYPVDTIYEALLPLEARNAIGKVGKNTEPVKKMLESIGFRYMEEVDPFDGGPHYRAPKEDISLVKDLSKNYIEIDSNCSTDELFLASINNGHDAFYSFLIRGFKKGDTIKVSHNYNGNLKNKMTVKAFRV